MPRIQPLLPFLRPLSAPRTCAIRPAVYFSTTTRWRAEQTMTPKGNTPPASPPASPPGEASRAADLAAAEARTEADSAQPPESKPLLPSDHTKARQPSKTLSPSNPIAGTTTPKQVNPLKTNTKKEETTRRPQPTQLELPPAKYHVARSSNNNYPVYTDFKRGGNLHLTTVRKITGDLSALRDELRIFLNKKNEDVRINALTQHVIVKGHHAPQITEFLKARGM